MFWFTRGQAVFQLDSSLARVPVSDWKILMKGFFRLIRQLTILLSALSKTLFLFIGTRLPEMFEAASGRFRRLVNHHFFNTCARYVSVCFHSSGSGSVFHPGLLW